MANRDRLTGLDAVFLDLEAQGAHMHVAGVLIFDGEPPVYEDLLRTIESRLDLVPRYRRKLAHVPFGQGRPEWVDDPHFNLRYHVRHSALPAPGGDVELARIAGRLLGLALDRRKPRGGVGAARRALVGPGPRARKAAVGAVPRRGARTRAGRGGAVRRHLEDAP